MGSVLNLLWNRNARPRAAKLPPGLSEDKARLNDSVWKLYAPDQGTPDVDILFFHGLQIGDYEEAFWKTWQAESKDEVVWPKDWLPKRFPKSRILSMSYNSSATRLAGQLDWYLLGENLAHDIILSTDIGQNCPVILVGHSLGGIVLKNFICSAIHQRNSLNPRNYQGRIDKINTFLKNFKGVFYYATPHGGSEIADSLTDLLGRVREVSPILDFLKTMNTRRTRINESFRKQQSILQLRSFALAESLPTEKLGFTGIVVEEAAVRPYCDQFFTHPKADHFTVCKARNKKDPEVIGHLAELIIEAVPAIEKKEVDDLSEDELQ